MLLKSILNKATAKGERNAMARVNITLCAQYGEAVVSRKEIAWEAQQLGTCENAREAANSRSAGRRHRITITEGRCRSDVVAASICAGVICGGRRRLEQHQACPIMCDCEPGGEEAAIASVAALARINARA